jgi:hypothetical protein
MPEHAQGLGHDFGADVSLRRGRRALLAQLARELVARRVVLPPDEKVPEVPAGHGPLLASHAVLEGEFVAVVDPKPPVDRDIRTKRRQRGIRGRAKPGGIDRLVVRAFVRRARRLDHIAAGARAREDPPGGMEPFQRRAIVGPALALAIRCMGAADVGPLAPDQAEPAKVVDHRVGEVHAEAHGVQVIAAQHEGALGSSRALCRNPERAGMAQVQEARGGRCQATAVIFPMGNCHSEKISILSSLCYPEQSLLS